MGSGEDSKLSDLEEAWKERELEAKVLKLAGHDSMALALRIYCVEIRLKTVICQLLKLEFLPKPCKTHDLNVLIEFTGLWRELNDPDNSGIKKNWDEIAKFSKVGPGNLRYLPGNFPSSSDISKFEDALDNTKCGVWSWLSGLT